MAHMGCAREPPTRVGRALPACKCLCVRGRVGVPAGVHGDPRARAPSVMTIHHMSGDARGQATRIRAHIAPRAIIAQTPVVSASRSMPPTHLSATCTAANTCSERPKARGWSLRAMLCDKSAGTPRVLARGLAAALCTDSSRPAKTTNPPPFKKLPLDALNGCWRDSALALLWHACCTRAARVRRWRGSGPTPSGALAAPARQPCGSLVATSPRGNFAETYSLSAPGAATGRPPPPPRDAT